MTDVELTRALEGGEIANENFHHASHLHVAWVYLSKSSSVSEAADKMRKALRKFAFSVGKLEKYHETITLFGCTSSQARTQTRPAKPSKKWFTRIRDYWKRIFRSLTIRASGFSAMKREPLGWSQI
jgi:hypothetical protein